MRPVDEEEVITTVTGCTKNKSSDFGDTIFNKIAIQGTPQMAVD